MSHTPGPWILKHTSVNAGGIKICQSGYVGGASVQCQMAAQETRKANARLIAAAPEMLELLQSLVSSSMEAYTAKHKPEDQWDEYDYVMIPQWKQAIDLINKATGAQEDGQ